MIVKLDKTQPDHQRRLAELRRLAAELGGEPRRSVICFKTFEEFNDYKRIFHKNPTPRQADEPQKRE